MKFALAFVAVASAVRITSDPIATTPTPVTGEEELPRPYGPWDEGVDGYERQIPDHFTQDTDDIFMRSVYTNYAMEERDANGKPTGKFYLDHAGAKALANEVVETHAGKSGAEAQ